MDTHRRRFGLLHLLSLALLLVGSSPLLGQEHLFRIMGYNVENLFDTEDDPTKDDDAFLPTGEQHWTKERYRTKLQHIAEVISAVGADAFPDLIGLVEVENATVLQDLLQKTTLGANTSYRYLVSSGEDRRGIDVALLYDPPLLSYQVKSSHSPSPLIPRRRPVPSYEPRDDYSRAIRSTSSSATFLPVGAGHGLVSAIGAGAVDS